MIWSDEKEEIEKLRDQLKKYRDWKLIEVREPGFSSKKVYWVEYDSTVVMEVRDGRMRVRTEYAPDREFKEVFRLVQHAFACEIELTTLTFEEAFEVAGFSGRMLNVVEKLRELKCEIREDANYHIWLIPRGDGVIKDWMVVADRGNHHYGVLGVHYDRTEGDMMLEALHWYGGEVKAEDFNVFDLYDVHRDAVLAIEKKSEDEYPVAQHLEEEATGFVRGIFWHDYLVGYCTVGGTEGVTGDDNYNFEENASWLSDVVIDPDWRGLGIGKMLVHSVIESEPLVYCTPAHPDLIRFYENLGFTKADDYLLKWEPKKELNSFK